MRQMTVDEIRAHDLRRARMHEAAHCMVARHLGYKTKWTTYDNLIGNSMEAILENKLMLGICAFYEGPVDPRHGAMIGLAGELIHMLEPGEYGDNYSADTHMDEIFEYFEDEVILLSASDAKMAGSFSAEDIDECMQLLIKLRPAILLEVEERKHCD